MASETIGQRLRRLRHERGLSQRELQQPGVSFSYISRIESGGRNPSVTALRNIAQRLGVSADYLETGIEETGMYALQRTSEGVTHTMALFPPDAEIEADEWAAMLTAAENPDEYADPVWHVEFICYATAPDWMRALAEEYGSCETALPIESSREETMQHVG